MAGEDFYSPAIGSDGTIYVCTLQYLYAIAPQEVLKHRYSAEPKMPRATRRSLKKVLKWEFVAKGPIHSSPAIGSDGTVYIGSSDSYVYAINPNGSLKWKLKIGEGTESSPAIGLDGTLYIGSGDHCIYAIE
jgi:outer membrane protein assembly factor BamB